MQRLSIGLALSLASALPASAQDAPLYKDARQPLEVRVADLLGRMTLEEKVAQLQGLWIKKTTIQDEQGNFAPEKAKAVMPHGIGQIARPSEIDADPAPPAGRRRASRAQHAEYVNAIQKWVLENTRLGIPVMFHEEALHGLAAPKGNALPGPDRRSRSTWDPALRRARHGGRRARGARARLPAGAVAGARPRARPALGPHRGDLRRGPVPRLAPGRRRHPRLPGPGPAARARTRSSRPPSTSPPTARTRAASTRRPASFGERLLREELLAPFEAAITEARRLSR